MNTWYVFYKVPFTNYWQSYGSVEAESAYDAVERTKRGICHTDPGSVISRAFSKNKLPWG